MKKMSRMSEFDTELREAGVDPERVDWGDVEMFIKNYGKRTGHTVGMVEAAKMIYQIGVCDPVIFKPS